MPATTNLKLVISAQNDTRKALNQARGDLKRFNSFALKGSKLLLKALKAAAIGVVAVGGAMVVAGGVMVKEAALAEGSWNKFNTVFGDGAEDMKAFIIELRRKMPVASSDIVKLAADLQDLLVPMGVARPKAQELSKGFLEVSNAIGAFNDVNPSEVLEAIKSGLAGSSEPLRKYGIDALETSLQARALEMGLIENVKAFAKLKPAQKTAIRAQALYAQIVENSSDAIKGFDKNSDSLLFRMQDLQATFKDIRIALGNALIPVVDSAAKKIKALLTPEVQERIARGFEDIVRRVTEKGREWIEQMGGRDGIKQWLVNLKDTMIRDVFPAAMEIARASVIVARALKDILLAAAKVINKYKELKDKSDSLASRMGSLGKALKAVAKINPFTAGIKFAKHAIKTFNAVKSAIRKLSGSWKSLKSAFRKGISATIKIGLNLAKSLKSFIQRKIKSFSGKQFGGAVRAGEPHIVGEHRPEVFIPSQSGNIRQVAGGVKDVVINFNNVSISKEADEDRLVEKIKRTLTEEDRLGALGVR